MKKFILFKLLIFISPILFAQQNESFVFRRAQLFGSYGIHFLQPNAFNGSLNQHNLPGLNSTGKSIGIGGGVFFNNLYYGGSGAILFGLKGSNSQYQTDYIGGFGMVDLGYALINKPMWTFYPAIGLGGGGSSIQLEKGPDYIDNTNKFEPGENLHTIYMLIDLGLNSNYFIGSGKNQLLLGISAGYQLTPYERKWIYKEKELDNLSKFGLTNFYVEVKLGWGIKNNNI